MGCCTEKDDDHQPEPSAIAAVVSPPVECVVCATTIVVAPDYRPPRNSQCHGAELYRWAVAKVDDRPAIIALQDRGYDFAGTDAHQLTRWRMLKPGIRLVFGTKH